MPQQQEGQTPMAEITPINLAQAKQNVNNAELALPAIIKALEELEVRVADLEDKAA